MVSSGLGYGDFLHDDAGDRASKLEQALAGQSAETVQRVRDYARAFDLDDDDELFAFAAAMGLLKVLVQDAPDEWRALFDELRRDLENWAVRNRQSLSDLKDYAQSAKALGETMEEVIFATNKASDSRKLLKQEMLDGVQGNADLIRQLVRELGVRIRAAEAKLEVAQQRSSWAAIAAGVEAGASLLLLLTNGLSSARLSQQNRALQLRVESQQTELGYLLRKANRAECFYGIKPPSDPQCHQHQ